MASRARAKIRDMLERKGRLVTANRIRPAVAARVEPEITQRIDEPQAHRVNPSPIPAGSRAIRGNPVFILASGPSLTAEDVELVRQSGIATIAVNRTFEIVPFATIVFAGDDLWWRRYHDKIKIPAERWTCAPNSAHRFKLRLLQRKGPYNSGMRAIQLAAHLGASKIYLLGFDARHDGKKRHWHSDYPKPMGNAHSVRRWPAQFQKIAAEYNGRIDIVNCSRDTALTCFPRMTLEAVLEQNLNATRVADTTAARTVAERDQSHGSDDLHDCEMRDDEHPRRIPEGPGNPQGIDRGLLGSRLQSAERVERLSGRVHSQPDRPGRVLLEQQAEKPKRRRSVAAPHQRRLSDRVLVG